MAGWQFGSATAAIDDARAVLSARDALAGEVERVQLDVPPALEARYEEAAEPADLTDVVDDMRGFTSAVDAIERAQTAVHGDRDIVETVGLWFSDAESALGEAEDRFAGGNARGAIESAQRAEQIVADAADAGRQRLAITAAVVLCVAVGAVQYRRSRARARRGAPDTSPG